MNDSITTPDKHKAPAWLPVVLLLMLGAALRIYRIDGHALSGDEAYSVVIWVQYSAEYLLRTIALATTEPHPPLALLALHGWALLVGDSVLALRMQSVLASVITLAAAYRIGRALGGERAALIGLALCALNPFQIWYAQFARNYSLWMAGSALTALFMLRAWEKPRRARRWVVYALSAVLTAYVFYLEALALIAHNLYALTRLRRQRGSLRAWVATQAAIVGALAPWYLRPELWRNSQDYMPNAGPANPLWAVQSLLVGGTLPPPLQHPLVSDPAHSVGIASVASAVLVIAALVVIWKTAQQESFFFLLFYGLVPPLALAGLALVTGRGYFHPRYVAISSVPLVLIAALGVDGVLKLARPAAALKRALAVGAAGMIACLSVVGLWNYHTNLAFARAPDWVRIMEVLSEQTTPNDLVIYNFLDPAFGYYFEHHYRGTAHQATLPTSKDAPYSQVAEELTALTADYDYVWFLPVESEAWDAEQNVARWLSQEMQVVSNQWIGFMRLYQYTDWQPAERQIAERLGTRFGDVALLEGYRFTPPPEAWQPGMTVHVEVFWRPLGQTGEDLKTFAHLWGPARPDGSIIWAQDDRFPHDGWVSTQSWTQGELLRDVYHLTLPLDPLPGEYVIAAGLYDPANGERVTAYDPQGDGEADHAVVYTLTLP
jgi:4-amino-4-deoxy-L-arabinose transferase-like glycosyltransferase